MGSAINKEMNCFFVTDLHGKKEHYKKLFDTIALETPRAMFIGGDILPGLSYLNSGDNDFIQDFLLAELQKLKTSLLDRYPEIYIILGNDDPRTEEEKLKIGEQDGLWHYAHQRLLTIDHFNIYGYSFVPPTPYQLKDWEKYDVSRHVDPGCISPEDGFRTFPEPANVIRYSTIKKDLEQIDIPGSFANTIFLFHSPPYGTNLDRTALDNKFVDFVPLDVHTGSIAIRDFIEQKQPLLTLHGHIHESFSLTGVWREKIGNTEMFSASYDKDKLALVKFNLYDLTSASREYL